jgi:hypothetical protein
MSAAPAFDSVAALMAKSQEHSGGVEELREAAIIQMTAAYYALIERGHSRAELGPLVLAAKALHDLKHNRIDPMLQPPGPANRGRRVDPTRVSQYRQAAVYAFEILRELGVDANAAAGQVSWDIDLPSAGVTGKPYNTIRAWQQKLNPSGKKRTPERDGQWDLLKEGRAEIKRCRELALQDHRVAREQLHALYKNAVQHGHALRQDVLRPKTAFRSQRSPRD